MRFDNVRLLVNDLPSCVRFYREVMSFALIDGDETLGYVGMGIPDGGAIGPYKRTAMAERVGRREMSAKDGPSDRFVLVLTTGDVDALVTDLKSRRAVFETGPVTEPWGGRTAQLRDPEGNLIELLQLGVEPESD